MSPMCASSDICLHVHLLMRCWAVSECFSHDRDQACRFEKWRILLKSTSSWIFIRPCRRFLVFFQWYGWDYKYYLVYAKVASNGDLAVNEYSIGCVDVALWSYIAERLVLSSSIYSLPLYRHPGKHWQRADVIFHGIKYSKSSAMSSSNEHTRIVTNLKKYNTMWTKEISKMCDTII